MLLLFSFTVYLIYKKEAYCNTNNGSVVPRTIIAFIYILWAAKQ